MKTFFSNRAALQTIPGPLRRSRGAVTRRIPRHERQATPGVEAVEEGAHVRADGAEGAGQQEGHAGAVARLDVVDGLTARLERDSLVDVGGAHPGGGGASSRCRQHSSPSKEQGGLDRQTG